MKDARELTPKRIVEELDRYIVGQDDAKRTVAIALRNRWRRQQLPAEVRDDVAPKNLMLIGPTGVGKTEIARRMASMVQAPFLKVEATRYTEVGYVGRNVESMIRDLTEISVSLVKQEEVAKVQKKADDHAEERILESLYPINRRGTSEERDGILEERTKARKEFRAGKLDGRTIEIDVDERQTPFMQVLSNQGMEEIGLDLPGALGNMFPTKKVTKKTTIGEARSLIVQQEAEKLIDRERVTREGLRRVQETGIIFIDEIDKLVGAGSASGPDVSRGGVQRDLLPIVEGATVISRYGPVRTDHILFIAAGAFSIAKPTDLIPELQGRFPLRAQLEALKQEDLVRILTEPKNAMIKQAQMLLETEEVRIDFTKDAIEEMAKIAAQANASAQDIGARRLHTVLERVLEDISFHAPEISPTKITINAKLVRERLKAIIEDEDLKKYIL